MWNCPIQYTVYLDSSYNTQLNKVCIALMTLSTGFCVLSEINISCFKNTYIDTSITFQTDSQSLSQGKVLFTFYLNNKIYLADIRSFLSFAFSPCRCEKLPLSLITCLNAVVFTKIWLNNTKKINLSLIVSRRTHSIQLYICEHLF